MATLLHCWSKMDLVKIEQCRRFKEVKERHKEQTAFPTCLRNRMHIRVFPLEVWSDLLS